MELTSARTTITVYKIELTEDDLRAAVKDYVLSQHRKLRNFELEVSIAVDAPDRYCGTVSTTVTATSERNSAAAAAARTENPHQ